MKRINHFEKNCPVHLALRDVYYERAVSLLNEPGYLAKPALDVATFEEILLLLRTSRDHGAFVKQMNGADGKDHQFCEFINMLAGNVKAILSILNLKRSVETEGGFFFSFLEANHASVALQAEEYERRARDIIRSLLKTLELAQGAYEGLKQKNSEGLSDIERGRYDKAATHHRNLLERHLKPASYRKRVGRFA